MLRDKILFVIKLQNLKQQVSFRHPSRRNEHTKMWETHPNDYWVFSKMADLLYHSFPGPPLSKMATESNFPCTVGTFRMSNSLPTCASLGVIAVGCPPPILRQTTERYISTPINGLPQDGGWGGGGATHGNRWLDVVDLLLISVCSIEADDTEKKTSEKFV